jgi:O-antigen ligase
MQSSVNGTLLALNFFAVLPRLRALKYPFPADLVVFSLVLITCALSKASIGSLSLWVGGAIYFSKSFKRVAVACVLALISASIFVLVQGFDQAVSFTGRDHTWAMIWQYMWSEGNLWSGHGPGSFYALFPTLQSVLDPNWGPGKEVFVTAHNDLLELFFTQGLIGVALWGGWFLQELYKSRKNLVILSGLACFLVNALGNFPSRVMLSALFLLMILNNKREIYGDEHASL